MAGARALVRWGLRWAWASSGPALLACTPAGAQQTVALPVIEVIAPAPTAPERATGAARTVLTGADVHHARPATQLDAALAQVPGAYAQNGANFAQDLRLSIRGQGARAPFGLRGIAVTVDGIPQTLPDGQSQVDGVDVLGIARMEVLRGPGGALYGGAAGGALDITTAWFDAPRLTAQAGGHGLRRARVDAGADAGRWQWTASTDVLSVDGDRRQSAYLRRLARAKARRDVGARGQLTVLADALDTPRAQDAGGLTAAERHADPDAAAPFAARLDAGERKDQQSLALRYAHALDAGTLSAQVFGSRRDFSAQLPFSGSSAVRFDRAFHGAGLLWQASLPAGGHWQAGVDARFQDDVRQRYVRRADASLGPRNLHQREAARALGVHLLAGTDPAARWQLGAGVRRDALTLAVHDRLYADGNDSDTRRFAPWSGEATLGRHLPAGHHAWLRLATAFETPTFTEFANPQPGAGGLNPDLGPQHARGAELGVRGHTGALRYELVGFALHVRDELLPYQIPGDGRDFFANAGRARHHGIETAVRWQPAPAWQLALAYTFARHRLPDHTAPDGTALGTVDRPGLPRHTGWAQLLWQQPGGRFAALEVTAIGPRPVDDAGTARAAGHVRVATRAGHRLTLAGGGTLELYAGAENLLNQPWTGNVRVNAAGARYFEPGPGRAVYAGAVWTPGGP